MFKILFVSQISFSEHVFSKVYYQNFYWGGGGQRWWMGWGRVAVKEASDGVVGGH